MYAGVCPGVFEYRWDRSEDVFQLFSVVEHTDQCAGVLKSTRLLPEDLAALLVPVVERTHAKPGAITGKDVKSMLTAQQIVANKAKVFRTRILILDHFFGTLKWNYAVLRSFCRGVSASDANVHTDVQATNDDLFRRCMLVPSYAKSFTAKSAPIMSVDAAFSTGRSGGGTWIATCVPMIGFQLHASSNKAAGALVLVAISFHSEEETSAAWQYHFDQMRNAGLFHERGLVICMSDGRNGLSAIIESTALSGGTKMHQTRDLVHLSRNMAALKNAHGASLLGLKSSTIYELIRPVAEARTRPKFDAALSELAIPTRQAHAITVPDQATRDRLVRLLRSKYMAEPGDNGVQRSAWIQAFCPGPRFGMLTSNMSESLNEVMNSCYCRHIGITRALYGILAWAHNHWNVIRHHLDSKVVQAGLPLYGSMGSLSLKFKEEAAGADVFIRGEAYFVSSRRGGATVKLQPYKCTCGIPSSLGIPCMHVWAVELFLVARSLPSVWKRFTMMGMSEACARLALAYEPGDMCLTFDELVLDDLHKEIMPSASARAPGPPRGNRAGGGVKRIRSVGEDTNASGEVTKKVTRVTKCRRCKQPGHNIRSCDLRVTEDPE